jgi:hypothetical protein
MIREEIQQELSEIMHALRDGPSTHNPKHTNYHYWYAVRLRWSKRAKKLRGMLFTIK